MAKNDAVAQAIHDTLGEGTVSYGGNLTDAVYAGFKLLANAIDGCEYSRSEADGRSLCKSIDGVAAALNNLAAAVRETKETR
jgi:hypothetical protein